MFCLAAKWANITSLCDEGAIHHCAMGHNITFAQAKTPLSSCQAVIHRLAGKLMRKSKDCNWYNLSFTKNCFMPALLMQCFFVFNYVCLAARDVMLRIVMLLRSDVCCASFLAHITSLCAAKLHEKRPIYEKDSCAASGSNNR